MDLLEIGFQVSFLIFFYGVIKFSWLRLWVLQVSQVDSSIFIDLFLTMYNFFNFIFQHRVDWELNFFYLFFIELSRSLDLGLTDYPGLTLIIFLSLFSWFFLQFHFLILGPLRIRLQIYFDLYLWGYLCLITWIPSLVGWL